MDTPTSVPQQIPFLVPEAVIQVSLGTQYIQRLTETLAFCLDGHEQSELAEIISSGSPLPPWAAAGATISQLLQNILQIAVENNQVTYRSLEDIAAGIAS